MTSKLHPKWSFNVHCRNNVYFIVYMAFKDTIHIINAGNLICQCFWCVCIWFLQPYFLLIIERWYIYIYIYIYIYGWTISHLRVKMIHRKHTTVLAFLPYIAVDMVQNVESSRQTISISSKLVNTLFDVMSMQEEYWPFIFSHWPRACKPTKEN